VCVGLLSHWQMIRHLLDNEQQNEFSAASFCFFFSVQDQELAGKYCSKYLYFKFFF
jgi:hypothetical protein